MIIQLPLSSEPAQTFTTQLGDTKYVFDIRWNDRSQVWSMDIRRESDTSPVLYGVLLVIGADLLQPFNLGMGHMIVVDENGTDRDATVDDLGSRVNLYWFSPDEALA